MEYFNNVFEIKYIGKGFNKFHLVEMTENPNKKIQKYRLRENIDNEVQSSEYALSPVDVVMATYVTPWVDESDTKEEFLQLCKDLLKNKNSVLISTDPGSSDYLVRSIVSNSYNANTWYLENLNLSPKKLIKSKNGEGGIIDSIQWTSGGF